MRVEEHSITIDDAPVSYREGGEDRTTLYLHGVPTSSDDWIPFLERTGGIAPDLIGFGRSGKGGHLDFSPSGLTTFVERFLAELGVERLRLVGHGWGGAIGLLLAAREPARVERLVLIDAVPLLDGFRWPRLVRMMRTPALGELLMGWVTRTMLTRHLRAGSVKQDAWSDAELRIAWDQFDQGTQRALLRLHRRADERRLGELGADLGSLELPALVVWGERDPWLPVELAERYAARLPHATVITIPDAGHWPWRDDPAVIDTVAGFLAKALP